MGGGGKHSHINRSHQRQLLLSFLALAVHMVDCRNGEDMNF